MTEKKEYTIENISEDVFYICTYEDSVKVGHCWRHDVSSKDEEVSWVEELGYVLRKSTAMVQPWLN